MLDNINKLFSYFSDADTIAISSSHDKYVGNNARYCVHVNKDKDINKYIWGYVIVEHRYPEQSKYTLDKLVVNDYNFSEESAKDILELAFMINYNTGVVSGYSIKLRKRDDFDDYELVVPELEQKRYWASRYFAKDEDSEGECE